MRPELDLHMPFCASMIGENQAVVESDDALPSLTLDAWDVAPIH